MALRIPGASAPPPVAAKAPVHAFDELEGHLARCRRSGSAAALLRARAESAAGLPGDVEQRLRIADSVPGVRRSFGAGFGVYVRNNITATQRLLEEAAQGALDAFVYGSSSSVYGNAVEVPTTERAPRRPESPYGMTKRATEDLAELCHRVAGVPVVGLRYFTVYGPRQRPDMAFTRFIDRALSGQPVTVLGDGHQLRDFTYVGDAVEATIAAGVRGRPGSVYNVGGGRPVELLSALHMIAGHCGGAAIEHQPVARGDVRATCADGGRALAELGVAPRVTLREGLRRQVAWARAQRAVAPLAA